MFAQGCCGVGAGLRGRSPGKRFSRCASAAEKVSSLGKNWHRPCLRCERCGKTLAAGSHAEVMTFCSSELHYQSKVSTRSSDLMGFFSFIFNDR